MKKVVGKAAGTIARKAVTSVAVGAIGSKVKEEVEQKMRAYKKRIALLALELGFFVLGFNFFMLGIAGLLSKSFPEELVFLGVGILLILGGLFFSRSMGKK